MVNKLHEQQIPIVIYQITGPVSEATHISIPNVEVISISSEADLKEVM